MSSQPQMLELRHRAERHFMASCSSEHGMPWCTMNCTMHAWRETQLRWGLNSCVQEHMHEKSIGS
eukprot:1784892-Amphidinium_carterae.1